MDRPEVDDAIVRVTGPFRFEATAPTPADFAASDAPTAPDTSFTARMMEVLRRSPVLRLDGNRTVTVAEVRPPQKALALAAEGVLRNGTDKPVAFAFGPENGPVSEPLVQKALREANLKGYDELFVVGFSIQPGARLLIEQAAQMGVPAVYLQATPDLLMGDLLKNMRSSQVFSVCGLPEIAVRRAAGGNTNGKGNGKKAAPGPELWQVELLGLDVFDPVNMDTDHKPGDNVPAWFLDTDYNEKCFHVDQAFFPRTKAWDNLQRELKGGYDPAVWDHLAGTVSATFEAGDRRQVAVKVIDDRGNELMVVKSLTGGRP